MATKEQKCPRCWGYDPKCDMCIQMRRDSLFDRRKERRLYLAELWIRAWKFRMIDFNGRTEVLAQYGLTGDVGSRLTDEVKAAFGPWRGYDGSRLPIPHEVNKLLGFL